MEENSIIAALYQESQQEIAHITDLKQRIAELEEALHQTRNHACRFQLRAYEAEQYLSKILSELNSAQMNTLALIKAYQEAAAELALARRWARAWKASAEIRRAASRSLAKSFDQRIDEWEKVGREIEAWVDRYRYVISPPWYESLCELLEPGT